MPGATNFSKFDPIRILLVDDHALMRQGLRVILETLGKFQVIGEAGDGLEAVVEVDRCSPDVVLMDVNIPGINGIEATRRIRATHPGIRVVGLSMHQSTEIRDAMIAAGASGYVTKSAEADELCAAVRAAVRPH